MSTQRPDQWVRLTKTVIDKLTPPDKGQCFVRDGELKGFGIRITASGVKSFIVEKRIKGRVRRMTISRYGELTVEQARKQAQKLIGQVAMGMDPAAEKQLAKVQGTTLAQAYAEFIKARNSLKPRTRYDYDRIMSLVFSDWQKKPILDITKAMIIKRHRDLGAQRGEAYANLSLRLLRAVFNFSQATYEDGTGHSLISENPVIVLSQTRGWFRNERRKTVIKVHQLPSWFQGVQKIREPISEPGSEKGLEIFRGQGRDVADYLLLVLFTGLRKQEALTLRWSNVDLKDRTLLIPDTKNHEALILPLSDFILELLTNRYADAVNDYVFPGKYGLSNLTEPKKQVARVIAHSGVSFTLHDLRRTFITIAESLDIPPYAIKRLVNHKMSHDVTAGYIISDVERLRSPMQKISDFLVKAMGTHDNNTVISFPTAKSQAS